MPRAARPPLLLVVALTMVLVACTGGAPTIPPTQVPAAAPPTTAPAAAQSPAAATPPTPRPPAPSPTATVVVPGGSPSPSPVAGVLVPPTPPPSAPSQLIGPIKIVSSMPRNGNSKPQTDAMVTAIKMALDELGNKVDGASVVYEDWDDSAASGASWDPDKEADNAHHAVDDPDVMVYIGPYNSGAAEVSIPILNQADLATISPSATYSGLTKPGTGRPNEPDVYYPSGKRNFVRVIPTDDVQGAVGAAWARQLGANRVYVLDDTELYGHAVAASFVEAAQKIGLQVIGGPEGVNPRAVDHTGIAAKVRDARPDLVYFGGLNDNNAGPLFQDLRSAMGTTVKLMGPDGIYQQTFLDDAGDAAEGIYATFGALAPSKLTGKGADWYRSFRVRYNAEPEVYSPYAYEATRVALDAVKRAGKKDRAAIRDALLATKDYEGILGRWSFDANGDTTLTTMSGHQVVNGKFDDANAVTLPPQ
jgi:branched-chain amino acid transport system substrate-binding protein